jgi:hypothetical protein
MGYCLFVEKDSFELIQKVIKDYSIPGLDFTVSVDDCTILPPHFIITTKMFSDVKINDEIKKFFKCIGYIGTSSILKQLTHKQAII